MQFFHNPRCRKSRETLAFVKEHGVEPEIIEYLKTPVDFETLKSIVNKLGIEPIELIRKNEQIFRENFKGKTLSHDEWIQAMVEYPKLIERPILITETKAVIGRPKENALELI